MLPQRFVYSPLGIKPRRVWSRMAWVECDLFSITVFDTRLQEPSEYIWEVRFMRWRWRLRRPSGKPSGIPHIVPMHEAITLVGGKVPAHVPGAYPTLKCCGGSK